MCIEQFTVEGMACVACVGSVEGIWRKLLGVRTIKHVGFGASIVQSDELDLQLLEGIFRILNGVYGFHFDRISEELEAFFSEVVDSSSLFDMSEGISKKKFKLQVVSPYARMTTKDVEETSILFQFLTFKSFLSIPIFLMLVVCSRISTWNEFLT
ncbi:hypothetical protein GQ457_18G010520 [Hibiscus cannabinus]